MQPKESKTKYVSTSRARTAGRSAFSGQKSANAFAQVVSNTQASQVDEAAQKRSRILTGIFIAAVSIILILAAIVLALRRFSNTGAGDIDIAQFNSRVEYHDAMKCTLYDGDKARSSDYMVMANDGWSEVYLRNIWLNNELMDVIYIEDAVYSVVYDGAKTNKNVVKEKSFIENKEQFAKRTGLDFPNGIKLADNDQRKIHCDAQGQTMDYFRPNVSRFTNIKSEGVK